MKHKVNSSKCRKWYTMVILPRTGYSFKMCQMTRQNLSCDKNKLQEHLTITDNSTQVTTVSLVVHISKQWSRLAIIKPKNIRSN